jgi:uncharacterized protein (TIGR02246 family)
VGLKNYFMHNDEKAIRDWGDSWLAASKKGDLATARDLMADDVVFMVPGKEPFGKDAFTVSSRETTGVLVDGTSDIQEIKVHGDWAWMRNRLKVTIRPPNGKSVVHSGYTLTILQKKPDGKWVITRDANLLTPQDKA